MTPMMVIAAADIRPAEGVRRSERRRDSAACCGNQPQTLLAGLGLKNDFIIFYIYRRYSKIIVMLFLLSGRQTQDIFCQESFDISKLEEINCYRRRSCE